MCHPQFVQALSKLLLNDRIQEHSEPPYCVNLLSVAAGEKLRLVVDLRNVNPCLFKHSFNTRICIAFLKFLSGTFVFLRGIWSQDTIMQIFTASIGNFGGLPGHFAASFAFSFSESFLFA